MALMLNWLSWLRDKEVGWGQRASARVVPSWPVDVGWVGGSGVPEGLSGEGPAS